MNFYYLILAWIGVATFTHAEEKPHSLALQISEAIASGNKLEFECAEEKIQISFIKPPDYDEDNPSNKPPVEPIFYSIGQTVTLVPKKEETIQECRERIALYCLRCRENGHEPIIRIYIYLDHNPELLKSLLDEVAKQKVEKVWTHIQTKEEQLAAKASKIERILPKPLPPSDNKDSN